MTFAVPFEYVEHFLVVPVLAAGVESRFIFDTGIGVSLISAALAVKAGCAADGTAYSGRRMSGQEVTVPLSTLPVLQFGSLRQDSVPVGILDLGAAAGLDGTDGFLSLAFFRSVPVTVDYPAGLIILEDEDSAGHRAAAGACVSVRVKHDGPATDVHLSLDLADGQPATVEIDSGSGSLILDERFAAGLGIDLNDEHVRKVTGTDETGQSFARYFTTLPGDISVTGAPGIRQAQPDVMFQKIIYDGLVGDAFLRNFTVTYDLANSRMIFAAPR